jgi:Tfp pilus assembly protein PilN
VWDMGGSTGLMYSRPMPRARNHIAALTEQHQKQSQRIVELEKLIEEVSIVN